LSAELSKSETADERFDLPQVMENIRVRAAERRANSVVDTAAILARVLAGDGAGPIVPASAAADFSLQPQFETRDHYRVQDFLCFNDHIFVRNAYRGILQREPDDTGFVQYLESLRSGRLNKLDILARLRFSPEGRARGVDVTGLSGARWRRFYRVPVLGYLLELSAGLVRLPKLLASVRQLEAHTAAQDERLAAYINDRAHALAQQINDIALEQLAEIRESHQRVAQLNQQQLKALFREQRELTEDQNRLKTEITHFRNDTDNRFKAQTLADEIQLEKHQELQEFVAKQIVEKLQRTRAELVLQEQRLVNLPARNQSSGSVSAHAAAGNASPAMDLLYVALEDQFRGARDHIQEALTVYLPILQKAQVTSSILDAGCGRGEWLELLKTEGFSASGIDVNRISIGQCRELGLDVQEADALTHLRGLANDSLNCVTAFHLVEHLSLDDLVSFVDQALRVLRPGGILILETPNPENLIVGGCNFYFDPTHRNPLPALTMKCILESRGFDRLEILELHPMLAERLKGSDEIIERFNALFYGAMDYAIVAHKL
jgi:O-antigen chain-terminating methyltransferase